MYRMIVFGFLGPNSMGYLFTQDCVFAASNENMLIVGVFFYAPPA